MIAPRLAPLALLSALLASAPAAHGATITGTVHDRTTNKPAAHDAVVLIGFGQGMQEVARTTTDAQGRYTLQVPEEAGAGAAGASHLVRVDHERATYFQPAPAGAHTVDVDVDVYDVAEKVEGISTEADVLSMQTDPEGLQVVENYFVRNDSKPAMTQLSRHAYAIYLPPGARLEASAAMGPAGMPVSSSPIPFSDPKADPGHYAFVFPIRPGETRFQVSYHLAYSGSLAFSERVALPTENLVVMLPKTMDFRPSGTEFQTVPDSVASQTFVRKGVSPGQAVAFTVSGTGSMPREAQGAQAGPGGAGTSQPDTGQGSATAAQPDNGGNPGANTDNRPGGGLGPPIDTPDPLNKYKWWILSGLALVLVAAAAWLLRKPRAGEQAGAVRARSALPPALQPTVRPPAPALQSSNPAAVAPAAAEAPQWNGSRDGGLMTALKEALFALEAERLTGRTSDEEYQQLKASLEVVLRQALGRESGR